MGDRELMAEQILRTQLSRRGLLKVGVTAPIGAAFLAACGAAATPPPTTAPSAAPTTAPSTAPSVAPTQAPPSVASATAAPTASAAPNFQGVTLQLWGGGTTSGPSAIAAKEWEALTGGKVVVTKVPFAERAIKFAGLIATQDSSIDLLYASGQFVAQFNERLYENLSAEPYKGLIGDTSDYLPAILDVFTANGGLRALPQHSEQEIYIYNKEYFKAAGLDPEKPPATWDELYAAAPKLTSGNRYPCAVPWIVSFGGGAYWLCFYNSFPGAKLLSDDRSQLLFDNDQGLEAFRAVERGFKSKFFDPNLDPSLDDYGTGKLFNAGATASEINFAELWGQAVSGNQKDFGTTIKADVVGTSIMPGVQAGTSGSINGFEGYGINKNSKNKEAALHYLLYETGLKYQKELNLTKTLPSGRISVLNDPDVAAVYPVGKTLSENGTHNLNRYAAPYDWTPPFSDAIVKLFKGDFTAAQAHAAAIKGVQDIIVKYLSS